MKLTLLKQYIDQQNWDAVCGELDIWQGGYLLYSDTLYIKVTERIDENVRTVFSGRSIFKYLVEKAPSLIIVKYYKQDDSPSSLSFHLSLLPFALQNPDCQNILPAIFVHINTCFQNTPFQDKQNTIDTIFDFFLKMFNLRDFTPEKFGFLYDQLSPEMKNSFIPFASEFFSRLFAQLCPSDHGRDLFNGYVNILTQTDDHRGEDPGRKEAFFMGISEYLVDQMLRTYSPEENLQERLHYALCILENYSLMALQQSQIFRNPVTCLSNSDIEKNSILIQAFDSLGHAEKAFELLAPHFLKTFHAIDFLPELINPSLLNFIRTYFQSHLFPIFPGNRALEENKVTEYFELLQLKTMDPNTLQQKFQAYQTFPDFLYLLSHLAPPLTPENIEKPTLLKNMDVLMTAHRSVKRGGIVYYYEKAALLTTIETELFEQLKSTHAAFPKFNCTGLMRLLNEKSISHTVQQNTFYLLCDWALNGDSMAQDYLEHGGLASLNEDELAALFQTYPIPCIPIARSKLPKYSGSEEAQFACLLEAAFCKQGNPKPALDFLQERAERSGNDPYRIDVFALKLVNYMTIDDPFVLEDRTLKICDDFAKILERVGLEYLVSTALAFIATDRYLQNPAISKYPNISSFFTFVLPFLKRIQNHLKSFPKINPPLKSSLLFRNLLRDLFGLVDKNEATSLFITENKELYTLFSELRKSYNSLTRSSPKVAGAGAAAAASASDSPSDDIPASLNPINMDPDGIDFEEDNETLSTPAQASSASGFLSSMATTLFGQKIEKQPPSIPQFEREPTPEKPEPPLPMWGGFFDRLPPSQPEIPPDTPSSEDSGSPKPAEPAAAAAAAATTAAASKK